MSLYNMIHGTNPIAPLLLAALGNPDVPRFRDCYMDDGRIAIHTRTGGGNRDYYESAERYHANYGSDDGEGYAGPWNSDLRTTPGYLYDEDDDFDCTYATFYFKVPDEFSSLLSTIQEIGAGRTERPADAWARVLGDLKSGVKTPETERAIEGMKPILEKISEILSVARDKGGE